jgi:hypothetical protein
MRSLNGVGEPRIIIDASLCLAHPAARLDTSNSAVREGAREPVARRKRLPRIENRRNLGYDRQSEAAPSDDARRCPQRAADLQPEDVAFARLGHDTRIRSFTSVQ